MDLSNEVANELILSALRGNKGAGSVSSSSPFVVGKSYHIRTVTMAHAGVVKSVDDKFIVLSSASWVADTGRFNEYLIDTSKVKENEPFKNDVIVGLGAIIDATQIHEAYQSVK